MDDISRWASMVPPAADSVRVTKENRGNIRDHNLTTALNGICGLPSGHGQHHYSIDELNGLPGSSLQVSVKQHKED
jgi:hypothetical protein